MDTIASQSSKRVSSRIQVWHVPLFNSLATIRERICIGSSSNAVSVSTHCVSTGVTLCFVTAARSSTFSYTPSSRRYSCQGSSFPMMSSKHWMKFPPHQPLPASHLALDQLLPISRLFQLWVRSSGPSSPVLQLSYHPSRRSSSAFLFADHPFRSFSPIFQLLQFSNLGSPVSFFFTDFPTFGSPVSIFVTNFPTSLNLIDLHVIRQSFTAGEHYRRRSWSRNVDLFHVPILYCSFQTHVSPQL